MKRDLILIIVCGLLMFLTVLSAAYIAKSASRNIERYNAEKEIRL